ncbi:MAG: hypothetical protein ACK5NA_09200 [Enterococcus sp.]
MRDNFEERIKVLHTQYGTFSMEDRRRILCHLRKKNVLLYYQLGRLKHEMLRLESKRVQLELEENNKQCKVVEDKILKKKEKYLSVLARNKK